MLISKITNLDDKVEQPNFSVKLFEYQLAVIKRMRLYETMNFDLVTDLGTHVNVNTNIGILGDRTGTGKTLCALGLINDSINEKIEHSHRVMNSILSYVDSPVHGIYINTSIVLYEKNTKEHWLKEVKRTGLRYVFIDNLVNDLETSDYTLYDVVLVANNVAWGIKASSISFPYAFKRLIVDNASATTMVTHEIRSYFTWYITDDYNLFCRSSKYSDLKKITNAEILVVKCNKTLYNNSKDRDSMNIKYKEIACKNNEKTRFNKKEVDYIKNLIDKLYYDEIIRYIGGKFYTGEELINNLKHEKTMQLQTRTTNTSSGAGNIVRFINNRIPIIQGMIDNIDTQTCCICLEDVTHPVMLNCCYNMYCNECIISELMTNRARCPNCKSPKMKVIALCDYPVQEYKTIYENLLDTVNNLPEQSRFLIVTDDYDTNMFLKWDSKKSINVVKTKLSKTIESFNNNKINGLVVKDVYKIKGVSLNGITDVFFASHISKKDRKRVIYTALNAVNMNINVHDLSYTTKI